MPLNFELRKNCLSERTPPCPNYNKQNQQRVFAKAKGVSNEKNNYSIFSRAFSDPRGLQRFI